MTREKIAQIIETYKNGNKTDFYKAVDRMSKLDIVNLISMMQLYHSTIAKLQIYFEDKKIKKEVKKYGCN